MARFERTPGLTRTTQASDDSPVAVGKKLGGYHLVAELGTGGMGTVYRAEDAAGETVAVKVLHAHLLRTPNFRERVLREADREADER